MEGEVGGGGSWTTRPRSDAISSNTAERMSLIVDVCKQKSMQPQRLVQGYDDAAAAALVWIARVMSPVTVNRCEAVHCVVRGSKQLTTELCRWEVSVGEWSQRARESVACSAATGQLEHTLI